MPTTSDDFSSDPNTTGQLTAGASVEGNFEQDGDNDWFAIQLQAGSTYRFDLQENHTYYPASALALIDASGNLLTPAVSTYYQYGAHLEYTAAATGVYYVRAASLGAVNSYRLSATLRTGADDITGGAQTTATLSKAGSISGNLESSGDHDWIRFHAEAGGHYQFRAQWATDAFRGPDLVIRDVNGAAVNSYLLEPAADADYYLDVSAGATGDYTIKSFVLDDDFAANSSSSGAVQAGGQIKGALQYMADVDRFKVTLGTDGFYTFSLAADSNAGYLELHLRDAAGTELTYANGLYTPGGPTLTVRPTTAGTYYVDAKYYSNGIQDVSPIPYTLSVSTPIQDDIADTRAGAAQLTVDTPASARIQGAGDLDMYKVALVAGKTYTLSIAPAGPLPVIYTQPTLTLTDGDGNALSNTSTVQTSSPVTFTPTASGTYYVAATGPMCDYTLGVSTTADDFAANAVGAGRVTVGSSTSGVLEPGDGDRDWFAVNLSAGVTYWLTGSHDWNSNLYGAVMRLLDAQGNELGKTKVGYADDASLSNTLAYVPTRSGTYYLEMSTPSAYGGTGAYTVSAAVGVRDDHGDTPARATPVILDHAVEGVLEIGSDNDTFKLDVTAGVTYGIDLDFTSANYWSARVSASDSAGNPISLDDWHGNTNRDSVLLTPAASGAVYVTINDARVKDTPYSLTSHAFGTDDYAPGANTSAVLAADGTFQARLDNPDDADAMRVHLEAGKSYVFELLGAASGNGTLETLAGVNFYLGNGNSGSLSTTSLHSSVEPRFAASPSVSGDYYLTVSSDYGSGKMGSYTVKAITLSGDAVGPALVDQSVAPGATGLALATTTFSFTFSEPITIDNTAIVLKNSSGTAIPFVYGTGLQVLDNKLVIKLNDFLAPDSYTLSLPHGAIHDLAGNQHAAPETLAFSTILPVPAPTAGNDLLQGGAGSTIDGGAGIDTVLYKGSQYSYLVGHSDSTFTVLELTTGKTDTLTNVERLLFDHQPLAIDADGNGGQAYRLYQAAFHRTPDQAGLGYWMAQLDHGLGLRDVAANFVTSKEFGDLYGASATNDAYINLLYNNVLHRAPDGPGAQYWSTALATGMERADVLIQFSESVENKAALIGQIGNGFGYTLF